VREISRLYDDVGSSGRPSTWPLPFGSGQYRYSTIPCLKLVSELRHAFYPYLLRSPRTWAEKLGKPAPWPDDLDEWLENGHAASAPVDTDPVRYRENDWKRTAPGLYGDLVFPMQVVIGLDRPGVDHTGGEFLLLEQRHGPVRGTATVLEQGQALVFTTRDRPVALRPRCRRRR